MFSPHDSPAVTDWFQRLDAAWRGLPTEERDSQREEIRQHLEGLVAASTALDQSPEAAWKSALARFGDPTQIGRRMYQEWQLGRTGFRADMRAILFGSGLFVVGQFAFQLLSSFWLNKFLSLERLALYSQTWYCRHSTRGQHDPYFLGCGLHLCSHRAEIPSSGHKRCVLCQHRFVHMFLGFSHRGCFCPAHPQPHPPVLDNVCPRHATDASVDGGPFDRRLPRQRNEARLVSAHAGRLQADHATPATTNQPVIRQSVRP